MCALSTPVSVCLCSAVCSRDFPSSGLTTDSVALQFWNGHKRSRARRQYRKNLEQLSLLRPILDNIDLSEEQYQWVNRQYMKIHMEIELAEDIDCNEEKPTCEREASEPTPVEEKPVKHTPVKE